MNLVDELNRGVVQLGVELDENAPLKMIKYLALLEKWNRVYNLTAIRDPQQMVGNHLIDSLAVLPHLWPGRWLDVGCGPGLPGIVLAIARPQWHFTLLDSNSKKTGFIRQAIIDLGLSNVTVNCTRVEKWQSPEKFDGIVSRAFASLSEFTGMTRHLLAENGRWAAMKGHPEEELEQLPKDIKVERVIPLEVPGVEAARCLVVLGTK